jgi:hypothetical protein
MDKAMVSGNEKKLRKKTRKLNRKETKLLAILADYLPDLDELLQDGNLPTTNGFLPEGEIWPPQPGIFLTHLDIETAPAVESSYDNEGENATHGTVTTLETPANGISSVPEPTMFALLSLGFAGLMFSGRSMRI